MSTKNEQETATESTEKSSSIVQEELDQNVKAGDKENYEPYEHLFFVRYYYGSKAPGYISGSSFVIPDGYAVFSVENFAQGYGYVSPTAGYDIWYTNTVQVEVDAIYNKSLDTYDYSHFGPPTEEAEKESVKQK